MITRRPNANHSQRHWWRRLHGDLN